MLLPLFPSRPTCTACPLHTFTRYVGLPLEHLPQSLPPAPHTPALICLGMNPGFQEDRVGRFFVGPSGRILHGAYLAGISAPSLASIYLANLARCYHGAPSDPPDAPLSLCSRLHLPIDLAPIYSLHATPLTILLLGGKASKHFHSLSLMKDQSLHTALSHQGRSITLTHTWRMHTPRPTKKNPSPRARPKPFLLDTPIPCTVFATNHPAALLRDHNLIDSIESHLSLLSAHLQGLSRPRTTPHIVTPYAPHI